MSTFVSNITFKSDTYEDTQEYNPPLKFDIQRYNYYIKLLNVRFSNNVPNVKTSLSLTSDGSVIATVPEGLYEVDDIVSLVNGLQSTAEFKVNESNGHMTIKNLTAQQHTFAGSLMSSIQFGGFSNVVLNASASAESPNMCQVSDFNFFKLASNIISPTSYETKGDKLIVSNTLYTFAATITKFGHKDFTAFADIRYPLNMDQLQRLDFELVDENGNKLALLKGSKSDFNIQAIIIKELKK